MTLTLIPHPLATLEGRTVGDLLGRYDALLDEHESVLVRLAEMLDSADPDTRVLRELEARLVTIDLRMVLYGLLAREADRES